MSSHDLAALLAARGYRTTRPRQAVWDALHGPVPASGPGHDHGLNPDHDYDPGHGHDPVHGHDHGPGYAEGTHLTAEEVAARVHRQAPEVNLASVYRTLALLRELGLVRESRLAEDEPARWELAHPDEHFHVVCDRCGRVDHHVGSLVASIVDHLSSSHRFVPERVDLVVHGHCVSCAC